MTIVIERIADDDLRLRAEETVGFVQTLDIQMPVAKAERWRDDLRDAGAGDMIVGLAIPHLRIAEVHAKGNAALAGQLTAALASTEINAAVLHPVRDRTFSIDFASGCVEFVWQAKADAVLTTLALGLPNRVAEQFAAQAFAVRNYARPRGEAATQIWQMQEGLRLRIHWREAWLEHLTALN